MTLRKNMSNPFYIILIFILISSTTQWSYFCNLNCNTLKERSPHVVCQQEPCRRHPLCGPNYKKARYTDQQRDLIVKTHNELRNETAVGLPGLTPAANMNAMSYSKELEFIAQCWANNCNTGGAHTTCHKTKDFAHVGQNTYSMSSSFPIAYWNDENAILPIAKWRKQSVLIKQSDIENFNPLSHVTENVIQMIMAETRYVGCAMSSYGKDSDSNLFTVCYYAPGGDLKGKRIFEAGEACSKCDKGVACNKEYPSLCGEIRPLADDKWIAPFRISAVRCRVSKVLVGFLVFVVLYFQICYE